MAVRMQQEYEGELNIVFVEVQGSSDDDIERMALDKKWFGTSAIWTRERPLITGATGIPNFVLLSADGEIALMGHPLAMHKEIEDHIAQNKRARTRPPADLPKELSAAWKNLAKGRIAAAIAAATQIVERPPLSDGDAVVAAAQTFIDRARAIARQRLQRIEGAIEEGAFAAATDLARQLVKDVDGDDLQAAQALLARLTGEDLAAEVRAEDALARIERRLYEKGGDKATSRSLARLAEKYEGTKAGARASRLAKLID